MALSRQDPVLWYGTRLVRMAKIWVYQYLLLDAASRQWVKQPGWAARAYVEERGGALIFGSKIEIEDSELHDGIYLGLPPGGRRRL